MRKKPRCSEPMVSCERVDTTAYNNEAAQRYTAEAVNALARSDTMRRYAIYTERREVLFHASLVAPICLFMCFYTDLVFGVTNDRAAGHVFGSAVAMAPMGVAWALSVGMQCLVLPWSMLAPFCGMFQDVGWEEARFLFGAMSLGRVLYDDVVHHRLFGMTSDDMKGMGPSPTVTALIVVVSVISAAGSLMVVLVVHRWRSVHWERATAVPLPLLSIPLAVGSVDFVCQRYGACVVQALASTTTTILPACALAYEAVLHLVASDAAVLLRVLQGDAASHGGGGADADAAIAIALSQTWRQSFFLGWVYIALMLVGTVLLNVGGWLRDWCIPTHPTMILIHLAVDAMLIALFVNMLGPFCWLVVATHVYLLISGDWSTEYHLNDGDE